VNKNDARHINEEIYKIFLRENSNREKITRRSRRFHYDSQVTKNTENLLVCHGTINSIGRGPPLLAGEECLFVLSYWHGGGWYGCDLWNWTIFTNGFAVTTMIISVELLGLHAKNLANIHNHPRW